MGQRYYSKSKKRRQGVDKSLSNPRNPSYHPNVMSVNARVESLKDSYINNTFTTSQNYKSTRQDKLVSNAIQYSRNTGNVNNSLERYI